MEQRHWQDWLSLFIGFWLVASPFVFPVEAPGAALGGADWNFYLTGFAAIVFAAAALAYYEVWEDWANVVIGLWLIGSPWVLGFAGSSAATWSAILAGVALVGVASWSLSTEPPERHA